MNMKQKTKYSYFSNISTRWKDNDVYGHINNVDYYSYFDSVINKYLIENGKLDIHSSEIIGIVVHSECNYIKPLAYPDSITVGLGVIKIGNTSVKYGLSIFSNKMSQQAAFGSVTHVFVDRESLKPVKIPKNIISALKDIEITT